MKSLTETIGLLKQRFFGTIILDSIDIYTGDKIVVESPAYLFRGENCFNNDLLSTRQRFLLKKEINSDTKAEVQSVGNFLDQIMRENFGLPDMWSASLLQHYGFPTEVIDATSDIDTAAAFAVSKNTSGLGRICIYPLKLLAQNSITIDLTKIEFARRPQRQHGYALFHKDYLDFRHPKIFENIEVEVFDFTINASELKEFYRDDYLYENDKDQTLGIFNFLIDQLYKHQRSSEVQSWLDRNIPWTEITTRVIEKDKEGRPIKVEPVLFPEQYISYQDWKKLIR